MRGSEAGPVLAPPDSRCKVTKRRGVLRERKIHMLDHIGGHNEFVVMNASVHNSYRAVMERVFNVKDKLTGVQRSPIRPDAKILAVLMDPSTRAFTRTITKIYPVDHSQVPMFYTGRKRAIYIKALEDFRAKGVCKKDAKLKAFVKAEAYNASTKLFDAIVPRLIQPRSVVYNLVVARYLKPIEHNVYKGIDKMFNKANKGELPVKTVFKGMNATQMGSEFEKVWSQFVDPVAIGFDADRFDQHCSKEMLEWEHRQYLKFFTKDDQKELKKLLSWQIDNKGTIRCSDGVVKYKVQGCRCSGDMNTGCGNCLIMCNMVYNFCHAYRISKFRLANNGDDCVLVVERKDQYKVSQDNIDEYFGLLGYSMTVEEPVYKLEHVEFCQMHPVFDGERYVMIRKPQDSISKDAISIKPFDSIHDYTSWIDSVGQCGMSLTGGIPMLQAYYNCLIRSAQNLKDTGQARDRKRRENQMTMDTGFYRLAEGMERRYSPVTDAARLSFYEAFGILPDHQMAAEQHYNSVDLGWEGVCKQDNIKRFRFHLNTKTVPLINNHIA